MQLSGNARIGGLLVPLASEGIDLTWGRDESIRRTYDDGSREVVRLRRRVRLRIRWKALEDGVAAALAWRLQSAPVEVVPRTRRPGDPEYVQEVALACEITSGLPMATAIVRGHFPLETELETLTPYEAIPGLLEPPVPSIPFGEQVDLLGGIFGQGAAAGRTTYSALLPYPGRLVRLVATGGGVVEVRIRSAGQALLLERSETPGDGGVMYIELPAGAHEIEVETGGERPRLFLDADNFAIVLLSETPDTATVGFFGPGEPQAATVEAANPLGGTSTLPAYTLSEEVLPTRYVVADYDYYLTLRIEQDQT